MRGSFRHFVQIYRLDCFAFARNDGLHPTLTEISKFACSLRNFPLAKRYLIVLLGRVHNGREKGQPLSPCGRGSSCVSVSELQMRVRGCFFLLKLSRVIFRYFPAVTANDFCTIYTTTVFTSILCIVHQACLISIPHI